MARPGTKPSSRVLYLNRLCVAAAPGWLEEEDERQAGEEERADHEEGALEGEDGCLPHHHPLEGPHRLRLRGTEVAAARHKVLPKPIHPPRVGSMERVQMLDEQSSIRLLH